MTKQPRWMTSVLAASTGPMPAMPWERGTRRRPKSMTPHAGAERAAVPVPAPVRVSIAAR